MPEYLHQPGDQYTAYRDHDHRRWNRLVKWFSGDPDDNPSRRGIEPDGESLEGFRTLRVAYEPDRSSQAGVELRLLR